jgi:hypothetical protein
VVAPAVLDALRLASEALTIANVRHVVVGGLAVGANGYPRATKDVDFLVGAEAFHHHPNGLVTMRPEVPFQVNGVAVADVIEMIKGGSDAKRCQEYLAAHAPTFVDAFIECVAQAEIEQD